MSGHVSELNPVMKVERFENINKTWKIDFLKVIHNQEMKFKYFTSQKMSANDSLYLYEMENFSPNLFGLEKYIFSGSALVTIGLAFLVQKAVYKSLKQIGDRPINQMIIPSQVKSLFIVFQYLGTVKYRFIP